METKTAQSLVAMAWAADALSDNHWHITTLCHDICKGYGEYKSEIAFNMRDTLVEALRELSDEEYPTDSGPELCIAGHIEDFYGFEIWWHHDGGTTEWTSDEPDWWGELKQSQT